MEDEMMKKHWKLLLLCVAIATIMCALCFSLNAVNYSGKCGDSLIWKLDTKTGVLKITGDGAMYNYSCSVGPNGEFPVHPEWYDYSDSIKKVEIFEGVTSIGKEAFAMHQYLKSISIPSTLGGIGEDSIDGGGYFELCPQLEEITVNPKNRYLKSADGVLYKVVVNTYLDLELEIFIVPKGIKGKVTILDGIKKIDAYLPYSQVDKKKMDWSTFAGRKNLTEIIIPQSVTSIGARAFSGCTSLKSAKIYSKTVNIIPRFPLETTLYGHKGSTTEAYATKYDYEFVELDTDIRVSGICGSEGDGSSLKWTIDANGVFTISGTGKLPQYSSVDGVPNTPWYKYRTYIYSAVIPNGFTDIGNFLFSGCDQLRNITIPNSVTSIGNYAFYNCSRLTNIEIPDGVTSIGYDAFSGCSSLASINIPKSVTSIGSSAFHGCSGLANIDVDASNLNYKSVDGVLFSIDGENLFIYPAKKNDSTYIIPDGVKAIEYYAFCDSCNLTSVTIPKSVTSIGSYAFSGCSNLTSITMPKNVKGIYNYAFNGCSSLASISIPNSVTYIGDCAFNSCNSLASITIYSKSATIFDTQNTFPSTSVIYGYEDSTAQAYATKYERTFVALEPEPQIIASGNCGGEGDGSNLTWTLDENGLLKIDGIGTMADYGRYQDVPWNEHRNSIKNAEISDCVTSIGSYAFYGCNIITSIAIPESITSIEKCAFGECKKLSAIDVNEINPNYKSIDGALFSKDGKTLICYPAGKNGKTYTIPENVTNIGDYAFAGCASLANITIHENIVGIGDYAFDSCTGIKTIDVLSKATVIQSSDGKTFPNNAVIICKSSSKTLNYATKYNCKYIISDLNNSATVGKDFSYNVYVRFSDSVKDIVTVRFIMGGSIEEMSPTLANENKYKFTFRNIAPQQLGDFINIELVCDGNVVKSVKNLSLKKYFVGLSKYSAEILQYSEKKYSLLKPLIYDIFDYCTAAQKFTGYRTDALINAGYEGMGTAYSAVTTTDNKTTGTKLDNAYFNGKTVYFDSTNKIVFYFITTDVENTVLTIGDKTYTSADFREGVYANEYKIYSDDIYATEFDKVFTCTISCNGIVGESVSYSIKSYAYSKQDKNDKTGELARCTYKYGVSALNFENADKTGGFEGERD
mgnify:FL=1